MICGSTMFAAKYAVLRQIETIFFSHHKKSVTFKVIWAIIWANLLFYVAILFLFMFACAPREKI